MKLLPRIRLSPSVLLLALGGLGLVGLSIASTKVYEQVKIQALASRSLARAQLIALRCKSYAQENDGRFPPSLDALESMSADVPILLTSPFAPSEKVGYTYHAALTKDSAPSEILLEDKFALSAGRSVVVRADLSGEIKRVAKPVNR